MGDDFQSYEPIAKKCMKTGGELVRIKNLIKTK